MRNTEVLNDLIRINHDRVEGYEKAAAQTKEDDLRSLFTNMSTQSRQFANELERVVRVEGGDPAEGTTNSGKIYRTWMDVKATFGGDDRKGILASCEFGEDAAQTAYRSALKEDDVDGPVKQLIENQQVALKEAHDKIKRMRDAAPND
jgi:uncharacterized protein (TIGR02284 family)